MQNRTLPEMYLNARFMFEHRVTYETAKLPVVRMN